MSNTVIRVEDLTKRIRKKTAMDGLSLEVNKGSVDALRGRNGAGKTTTIKMLLGRLEPDSGSASALGFEPQRQGVELKRRVGYVAENQKMYDWMTVEETMRFSSAFYPTWDRKLADELCVRLELSKKDKLKNLSRGMYGKVALLLAMAHKPELLILDDATSGLDVMVRRDFMEGIVDLIHSGGKTVFFSSHIIDEVEGVADHVAIIEDGELIIEGTMDQLKGSVKQVRMIFTDSPPKGISIQGMLQQKTEGHEVLATVRDFSEDVLRSAKEEYSPESVAVIDLSLEDIFVALAGKRSER